MGAPDGDSWYRMKADWHSGKCDDSTCVYRCREDGIAFNSDYGASYGDGDLVKCVRSPKKEENSSHYYSLARGKVCPIEHIIRDETECHTAIGALGFPNGGDWHGAATSIPQGCSSQTPSGIRTFETSTGGAGAGRDNQIPICKRPETKSAGPPAEAIALAGDMHQDETMTVAMYYGENLEHGGTPVHIPRWHTRHTFPEKIPFGTPYMVKFLERPSNNCYANNGKGVGTGETIYIGIFCHMKRTADADDFNRAAFEEAVGGDNKKQAQSNEEALGQDGGYEILGFSNHAITLFAIIGALSLVYHAANFAHKSFNSNPEFTPIKGEC